MISPTHATPPLMTAGGDSAGALALRLAHAENALLALASGQIDAVIDPEGRAYLLRPAQENLRQNERRLQAVIDSVPDVIAVVNRGGEILSLNHAARKVLGCEPEQLTGKSIFEHIHPDDFPAVHAAFFNVAEGIREHAGLQFRYRAGDGSSRIIHAAVAILRDVSPAAVVFSLRPGVHRIFQPVQAVRPETAQLAKELGQSTETDSTQ
jgi:PAS domain S-box-containing protein